MKEIISNIRVQKSMLALSVLILLLNNYELTFAVWFLTAVVTIRTSYSEYFLKMIVVLLAVLAIALMSSLFNDHKSYNFFRDVAYLLKPIIGLFIGYNITKTIGQKAIYTIVYIGIGFAVIHIAILTVCYTLFAIRDIHMLRHYGGYFNDYEIYVIVILLFRKDFGLHFTKTRLQVYLFILFASAFLYLARTNIIQIILLVMAIKGYFRLTRRNMTLLFRTIAIILIVYGCIYYSNPNRKGQGMEAFLYKIKIAPIESFKTHIDEDDWKDFNDNYRSFENIITVRQVGRREWPVVVFGEGLGSTIDIGREMWTNDEEFIRYVPTLHNAYMTMFLKAGLAGVLLSFVFIWFLAKHRRSEYPEIRHLNDLFVGSAIFLILSNWVFMGLYLKLDSKSIFLGFLICYREIRLRQLKAEARKIEIS